MSTARKRVVGKSDGAGSVSSRNSSGQPKRKKERVLAESDDEKAAGRSSKHDPADVDDVGSQSARTSTPKSAEKKPASVLEQLMCWICMRYYDCKDMASKSIGSQSPQCCWCDRSVQALGRAATSQGEIAKQRLASQRAIYNDEYKLSVMTSRVGAKSEAPFAVSGAATNFDRSAIIRRMFHGWEAAM